MILFSLLYITVLFLYKCFFVWINTMWNQLKDLFLILYQLIYQSKIHLLRFQDAVNLHSVEYAQSQYY